MVNIPKLIKEAHDNAVERGFYVCPECAAKGKWNLNCPICNGKYIDPNRNIGELLMLIVSELGEALEAHRCGKVAGMDSYEYDTIQAGEEDTNKAFRNYIKDTFEDELADVFIRLFDLCGYLGIKPDCVNWEYSFKSSNIATSFLIITEKICNFREYYELNDLDIDYVFIELIGFTNGFNIPIEKHIKAKMAYNRTRPHKHGKEY